MSSSADRRKHAKPQGPSAFTLPGPMDLMDWSVGTFTGFMKIASAMVPGANEPTREIQNQIHAVEWFAFATQRAGLRSGESLQAWLSRVDPMDLDHRPWAAEGAAYYAAKEEFKKGPRRAWLHEEYPEWTRTVLHTGLGLALAELTLADVPNEQRMAEAVAAFTSLCIENSQPGYEGCALEQIGLLARHMHMPRVRMFDRLLSRGAPELREYFWHGFGRGSYLTPGNLAPWRGSGWRAIQAVSEAAPDLIARRNAISGASWAFTLVNLRTPVVMEDFLKRYRGWALNEPAFADGVRSGLMVWRQMQPNDPPFGKLERIISRYFDPGSRDVAARGATFRFGS